MSIIREVSHTAQAARKVHFPLIFALLAGRNAYIGRAERCFRELMLDDVCRPPTRVGTARHLLHGFGESNSVHVGRRMARQQSNNSKRKACWPKALYHPLDRQTVHRMKDHPADAEAALGYRLRARKRHSPGSGVRALPQGGLFALQRVLLPAVHRTRFQQRDFKKSAKGPKLPPISSSVALSLPEPHECWLPLISGAEVYQDAEVPRLNSAGLDWSLIV